MTATEPTAAPATGPTADPATEPTATPATGPTAAPAAKHLSAAGLRIVRGNPDPHELAALTAVLFGLGRRDTAPPAPAGPAPWAGWRRRSGVGHLAGHPGAMSWRR